MQKIYLLFTFIGAVLLCGCNQQAKENSKKIDLLAKTIIQIDQSQSQQMAALQAQLTSLAPMLEKMNGIYFEKNRDDALFFHTNTLYLLLTIGKQIEAQLQTADAARETQSALVYGYHTNELHTLLLCTAQLESVLADQENHLRDALTNQEKSIEANINAETRRVSATANNALLQQIKLSAQPDANEIAQRTKLAADVAQIQRDLDAIKVRLAAMPTTPPVSLPVVQP